MKAKYIFRLDDICENMDWDKFDSIKKVFEKYNVKPIIGVIPKNCDKDLLKFQCFSGYFWEYIKFLQDDLNWSIALHGYTHVLESEDSGILQINKRSEFAGRSKKQQYESIKSGKMILDRYGLKIEAFMAPAHSFDDITIECLKKNNINVITDGYSIFPYYYKDILFVPQLFSRPRKMPFGVYTWCIHSNSMNENDILTLEEFIKNNINNIITFPDSYKYTKKCKINDLSRFFIQKSINFIRRLRIK